MKRFWPVIDDGTKIPFAGGIIFLLCKNTILDTSFSSDSLTYFAFCGRNEMDEDFYQDMKSKHPKFIHVQLRCRKTVNIKYSDCKIASGKNRIANVDKISSWKLSLFAHNAAATNNNCGKCANIIQMT